MVIDIDDLSPRGGSSEPLVEEHFPGPIRATRHGVSCRGTPTRGSSSKRNYAVVMWAKRIRMRYSIVSLLIVSLLSCAACAQETTPVPARPRDTKDNREWTAKDPLPLLRADLMKPSKDADLFAVESSYVRYPKVRTEPTPPTEKPFETDSQAVAAARDWIRDHFGNLPDGVSLNTTSVQQSASGRPKPSFDWDIGHTITFTAYYHGIPTDNSTFLYIIGKTHFSGTIDLRSYTPLKIKEHVVTPEAAKTAWRKILAARENAAETLKLFDIKAKPKLHYVWSPKANNEIHGDIHVLAPTWILDDEGLLMVDGHSGQPWFND